MPVNYVGLRLGADGKPGDTLAVEIKEMIRARQKAISSIFIFTLMAIMRPVKPVMLQQ